MFGLGFVQGRLVLETDASTTAANILAHESWFRVGFASVLIGTACYVAVTALLYVLLEPVNRRTDTGPLRQQTENYEIGSREATSGVCALTRRAS